jgi:glycosyltransferase involved in cell wall biosynthesis
MKKVLIITYYWPPSGGAGVQRWLKFAKYLPEFGWEPVILTVDAKHAAYPVTDSSLEQEIPAGIAVYRTAATDWFRLYSSDKSKTPSAGFATGGTGSLKSIAGRFIRGNFFIPDPRRGWNRFAFAKACEIIEREKIAVVVTTSPPHSTQLTGLKLKKRFSGLTWIADLRDPWTDIYYYNMFYPTPVSKMIDASYEKSVLKNADRIISAGYLLGKLFESKLPAAASKTEVITNGFDEADFDSVTVREPSTFTITYVGTLSEKYRLDGYLNAVSGLGRDDILLRFVGKIPEQIRAQITASVKGNAVEFIDYVSHRQAISYMASSSLLLLVIPESAGSRLIITGKIFEYIATCKPILCTGPVNGEAAEIISKLNRGACFGCSDKENIARFIEAAISKPESVAADASGFSRRSLTEKLASVFNSAAPRQGVQ